MKNPEIIDANGVAESLSIMFHKDNCSVIAIQDTTEESVMMRNANSLCLFSTTATSKRYRVCSGHYAGQGLKAVRQGVAEFISISG